MDINVPVYQKASDLCYVVCTGGETRKIYMCGDVAIHPGVYSSRDFSSNLPVRYRIVGDTSTVVAILGGSEFFNSPVEVCSPALTFDVFGSSDEFYSSMHDPLRIKRAIELLHNEEKQLSRTKDFRSFHVLNPIELSGYAMSLNAMEEFLGAETGRLLAPGLSANVVDIARRKAAEYAPLCPLFEHVKASNVLRGFCASILDPRVVVSRGYDIDYSRALDLITGGADNGMQALIEVGMLISSAYKAGICERPLGFEHMHRVLTSAMPEMPSKLMNKIYNAAGGGKYLYLVQLFTDMCLTSPDDLGIIPPKVKRDTLEYHCGVFTRIVHQMINEWIIAYDPTWKGSTYEEVFTIDKLD